MEQTGGRRDRMPFPVGWLQGVPAKRQRAWHVWRRWERTHFGDLPVSLLFSPNFSSGFLNPLVLERLRWANS